MTAAFTFILASCARDGINDPRSLSTDRAALAAKASTALAVISTTPPYGDQGTTVDVHIFGTGFEPGAKAHWLLNGVADDHVHTNSTSYVSSTELVANVTIASDAQLALWDVQVALSNGKNGVGSDLFEVTAAELLGPGTTGGDANIAGISEQLQVVGYATQGGGFVFDDSAGMVALGNSQVMTIDPLGTVAAGMVGNFVPTAWNRQAASSWVAEQLPQLPYSLGARVQGAARAPDGTVLLAGLDDSALSSKQNAPQYNRVVLWRRLASGWATPVRYRLPAGSLRGSANDVNGREQIVGGLDGSGTGAVWEDSSTSTRLDGSPQAINESGTLVVGSRSGVPVYWWRDPVTRAWNPTGVALPALASGTCASNTSANDVNDAGVIVGSSCNSAGKRQATVWRLDFSGASPVLVGAPTALPGLGPVGKTATDVSSAAAVTQAAPYVVAGGARLNGTRLAVRWRLP